MGRSFAGLQNSDACFCGNSFGRYGTDSGCTYKCSGNPAQTCGAGWRNEVYLRIDYGDGQVIRGSSTKMVISQLCIVIFRNAIHH